MNLLLFSRKEYSAGRIRIEAPDPRIQHIQQVLKLQSGDWLRAAMLQGERGRARLLNDAGEGVLLLEFEAQAPAGPLLSGQVFLALPRPQCLKRVLQLLPQLGIRRLVLMRSARVEKSFFHSPVLSEGEWRRQLKLGMEQATQSLLPEVLLFERFKPFIEDVLPGMMTEGQALLLHPGGRHISGLAEQSAGLGGEASFAIGPEGGWQEHEVAAWERAGFARYSLGSRIMKVDIALHHALAQVKVLKELHQRKEDA